jgi:hypothetical protein
MPTPPKKRNTTTIIEQQADAQGVSLDTLASALDAMDSSSEAIPSFDEDQGALPDYVQTGAPMPIAPPPLAPIAPAVSAKANTPTHAVIARELSGFKAYIGDSQRISVYHEDDLGKRSLVNEYGPKEIEAYGSVESFVQRVIARNYGGGGIFPIVGISANGKKFDLETVRIAKPTVDPKETASMDMTRDLLDQLRVANERILEARTSAPQQPNPLDQLERLEEFKRKAGGDQNSAMMMMMMMQQQQQRGPDPAVLQLQGLVEKVMDRFARLEQVVMAPPPPPPPPMPMGPDPMELVLRVAEVMRPAERANPIDDLVKLKGLTQNEGALSVEKLVGTVIPQLLANVQTTTPFRERLEELALMKKLMGASDDNPFTGLLKSFMGSQLGAGLGAGLGDAIRARSTAPALPAPQAAPQAPAAPPQTLPEEYMATFEPRLLAAVDDAERVSCVVDSLLSLASDPHWGKLSNVFLQAALQDDLAQTTQLLFALFNLWGQSGSKITKDKTDEAIRAVSTNWDVIVVRVCAMVEQPIPESARQRQFAAAAAVEKSASSNGQSGPSTHAVTQAPAAVSA